jgi:phosphoserine phosphatase
MTQDEIIRMAREAGPLTQGPFDAWCKRFAALVAAAEREACAKVCEEIEPFYGVMFANAIRARGTP